MREAPWQRHEREVAEALPGGETVIMSGRGSEKLDVTSGLVAPGWRWIVSCKSTSGKGIRVTPEMWEEASEAAWARSWQMRPAMALRVYGEHGSVRSDLMVVSLHDWAELQMELGRTADA